MQKRIRVFTQSSQFLKKRRALRYVKQKYA